MKKGQNKYFFNHNFFSSDSEEVFYWAGFIAADGCVRKRGGSDILSISLHTDDKEHLIKFKNSIGYTGNINSYKYGNSSSESKIMLYSSKIFNDLRRFNIVPRKTYVYEMPEWLIGHDLLNHFIRGYSDGDGSFYSHNNKNISQLVFCLRGTKNFLHQIENVFRCDLKIKQKKVELSSKWYALRYEGNGNATKIRDYLYKNSLDSIRLSRKYNIAKHFSYRPYLRRIKSIVAYNDTEQIKFESIISAIRSGYTGSLIHKCLKDEDKLYSGFKWKYVEGEHNG